MNKERVQQAIDIMTRAGLVNMETYQTPAADGQGFRPCLVEESQLHECGTGACFAGWVAVSPEFHQAGGGCDDESGMPFYDGHFGAAAIAEWLDVNIHVADGLVFGTLHMYGNHELVDVTREQVIGRLTQLRDGDIDPRARESADLFRTPEARDAYK